jgi:hypothetical protein
MGIAGVEPRQLAPTMGMTGSGSTDSPAPAPTNTKIDIDNTIDTAVGIAVRTDIDTNAKINIDTIIDSAIDTVAGIAVPAIIDANPPEPEVDIVESIIINTASPSTTDLTPAATIVGPTPSTAGAVSTATGGFDMAFGLFNFRVDSDGAMELISISDSAPLTAETSAPPAVVGNPSTIALLAPSEEELKLRTSAPSVRSNDFKDPPPSPTIAYCVDCDAYHYVGAGDFSSHEIAGCEDPRGGHRSCLPDNIRVRAGSQRPHASYYTL